MIIGILLNIIIGHLVIILKIYIIFIYGFCRYNINSVMLGPIQSFVGIATNFIISMTVEYVNLHFAIVNVVIGLTAGVIAKKHDF